MRDHPRSLMLFAAGKGTRMRPLTDRMPKPLVPVAGRALIDHALALADEAGIGTIVANIHHMSDMMRRHLAARPDVLLSDETAELLETGGGLRRALPLLGEGPVLALNTDAVWTGPNPLARLRAAWDPARMEALLLLVPRERATGHAGAGDFLIDDQGRLTRGPGHVYTGAQVIRTERLASVGQAAFSIGRLWDDMAAEGRLYGVMHEGGWADVGRPDAIALAENLLAAADV